MAKFKKLTIEKIFNKNVQLIFFFLLNSINFFLFKFEIFVNFLFYYFFTILYLCLLYNSILEEHVPLLGRTYTTKTFQLYKPNTGLVGLSNDDESCSSAEYTTTTTSDIIPPSCLIIKE